MANIDQQQNEIQKIEDLLEELLEREPDELTRESELGTELSFSKGVELLETLYELLNLMDNSDLEKLPIENLGKIRQHLDRLNDRVESIETFNPDQQNPAQTRDNILSHIDDSYQTLLEHTSPILSLSAHQEEEIERLRNDLNLQLEEVREYRDEMENILNSAREASGKIGVSRHSNIFQDEALKHKKLSYRWAIATGGAAIITLSIAYLFTFVLTTGSANNLNIMLRESIGKLAILSVSFYLLVWCSRNYFASRHNYIVNRHRQNALNTFETFVNASEDPSTKDAVLVEATESIFSFRNSGYKKESEDASSSRVQEVVRMVRDS